MYETQNIYAGFWKRFLAWLIDTILLGIVSSVLAFPLILMFAAFSGLGEYMNDFNQPGFTMFTRFQEFNGQEETLFAAMFIMIIFFLNIISAIIGWLYFALMQSSKHQATLGKKALNLKVTDMEGKRISFGKATGRYFGKYVSGMILMIGYIIAAFTEKKQALHDIMANTLVIDKTKEMYMDEGLINEGTPNENIY